MTSSARSVTLHVRPAVQQLRLRVSEVEAEKKDEETKGNQEVAVSGSVPVISR